MVVIKLKDILKESKVGYLVEKELTAAEKEKIGNQTVTYKNKETGKNVNVKVSTAIQDKKHPAYKKAVAKLKSIKKSTDKKVEKDIEKIKNIKFTIQSPKGDKEVSVKDVLPNFGTDKKDKDTPATKKAQKQIHKYFEKKYEREGDKEFKKRMKDTDKDGKPKLSEDEQQDFDKEVEKAKEYNEKNKGETWFTEKQEPTKSSFLREKITDKQEAKSDYYDPDSHTGDSYWDRDTDGGDDSDWLSDFDDDDDWGDDFGGKSVDAYGEKLSSKRGGKEQQQAMELKLRVPVGNLKKIKQEKNHYVTNEDGNKVQVTVFQDPKTKKYHAVDDEGNIYENDTTDFTKAKSAGNLGGYPGGQTKTGKKISDKRLGKDDDDDYETTTFADLLSMLSFGASDDIDWTDPI